MEPGTEVSSEFMELIRRNRIIPVEDTAKAFHAAGVNTLLQIFDITKEQLNTVTKGLKVIPRKNW